jgi:hypothetical protein
MIAKQGYVNAARDCYLIYILLIEASNINENMKN